MTRTHTVRSWISTAVAVLVSFPGYAASVVQPETENISRYVIAAADDGSLLRPRIEVRRSGKIRIRTEPIDSDNEIQDYLDAMVRHIDRAPRDNAGRRKILIFTHGGLNSHSGAIGRAFRLVPIFKAEKQYYPIFIAWNSAPFSCYGEHLLFVRQGERRDLLYGLATSPFYFAGDLARGVSRAPVVLARSIENSLTQPAGLYKNSPHAQPYIYAHEANRYLRKNEPDSSADVTMRNVRESDWRGRETIGQGAAHIAFTPTKVIGALLLDTIGTGSWDIMLRRANVLFDSPVRLHDFAPTDQKRIARVTQLVQKGDAHTPVEPETRKSIDQQMEALLGESRPKSERKVDYHARSRAGAVELLLRRLAQEERNGKSYSITLVGHSMGAIVSNEMLKRHPELSFDRIVYLAAACSVKDCQDSIVPYLRRRIAAGRPANFYNLSLHPVAEVSEAVGGDPGDWSIGGLGKTAAGVALVPRGSLLEWLDDFFTKPMNYEERRLGKWATAITSVEIFPKEVRKYIHLKMFPVGVGNSQVPEEHGNFADGKGEVKFWKEDFIRPTTTYEGHLPRHNFSETSQSIVETNSRVTPPTR